ncbi:MAG: Holliday junction resolvase RuvX [Thermodesulfobacteriota bacterium]
MRIMGLDLGKKRIGVAISDESGLTAQPLTQLERSSAEKTMEALLEIAAEWSVGRVVVGVPYNMDGSTGAQAKGALKFAEKLRERGSLEVDIWDERLSTVAVTRVLISGDVSRSRRKGVTDKLAAAYILQGYLDGKKESPS